MIVINTRFTFTIYKYVRLSQKMNCNIYNISQILLHKQAGDLQSKVISLSLKKVSIVNVPGLFTFDHGSIWKAAHVPEEKSRHLAKEVLTTWCLVRWGRPSPSKAEGGGRGQQQHHHEVCWSSSAYRLSQKRLSELTKALLLPPFLCQCTGGGHREGEGGIWSVPKVTSFETSCTSHLIE